MAIIRTTLTGEELTPEKRAAIRAELEAAAKLPYTYDPDCPPLTDEQLAEFRPVHFDSMEERAKAMNKERSVV